MIIAAACGKAVPCGETVEEAVDCRVARAVACCLKLRCKAIDLRNRSCCYC